MRALSLMSGMRGRERHRAGIVRGRGVLRRPRLVAVRAAGGLRRGPVELGPGRRPGGATPVVAAGVIYFGSFDNRMYALAA